MSDDSHPRLLAGGNPQIPKGDGEGPVQAYLDAMPGWKQDIGRWLDALVVDTVPDVRKGVRWNSPFYGVEGQGWFLSFHCYTRYVKVTFFKGTSLEPVPPGQSKDDDGEKQAACHESGLRGCVGTGQERTADRGRQRTTGPFWILISRKLRVPLGRSRSAQRVRVRAFERLEHRVELPRPVRGLRERHEIGVRERGLAVGLAQEIEGATPLALLERPTSFFDLRRPHRKPRPSCRKARSYATGERGSS